MNVPTLIRNIAWCPEHTYYFCTPVCRSNYIKKNPEDEYERSVFSDDLPLDDAKCDNCGKGLCIVATIIPDNNGLGVRCGSPLYKAINQCGKYHKIDITDAALKKGWEIQYLLDKHSTDWVSDAKELIEKDNALFQNNEGEYYIEVEASLNAFFGTDNVTDITLDMVKERRWTDITKKVKEDDFVSLGNKCFLLEDSLPDGHPVRVQLYRARIEIQKAHQMYKNYR